MTPMQQAATVVPSWARLAALLLLLALALPDAACQTGAGPTPGAEPAPAPQQTALTAAAPTEAALLTVCVVPWEPIAMCNPAAASYDAGAARPAGCQASQPAGCRRRLLASHTLRRFSRDC